MAMDQSFYDGRALEKMTALAHDQSITAARMLSVLTSVEPAIALDFTNFVVGIAPACHEFKKTIDAQTPAEDANVDVGKGPIGQPGETVQAPVYLEDDPYYVNNIGGIGATMT